MFSQQFVPLGFTSQSSTGLITPTIPVGTTDMLISVATNAVNYRDDGTAPTAGCWGWCAASRYGLGDTIVSVLRERGSYLVLPRHRDRSREHPFLQARRWVA
jgi:hypothetical protein